MSETLRLLEPKSPSWPAELEHIDGPPDRLWGRGRMELLARGPRVAIVGTRSPTPYGQGQARRFALHLARAGCIVVSGMARGIDRVAHEAALEVEGGTLAFLGSGVDRPWPGGRLAERLARDGLLLSEHPPGQGPRPHHFPLRNRLISGVSVAVVVIEAAEASGSLITARWATDQGRDVYALPGRVDQPMARGCHRLLREGATLIEDPSELTDALGREVAAPSSSTPNAPPRLVGLPARLVRALEGETLSVDELSEVTRADPTSILGELVHLELEGHVVRAPGGLYRLV